MIKYVVYKNYSVNHANMYVHECNLIQYVKGGILRGPWDFDWCMYASMCLFTNRNFI